MFRRLLLTFSTGAWLMGTYLLYAQFVTPRIEVVRRGAPAVASTEKSKDLDNRPAEYRELAQQYLPDVPWAPEAEFQFLIGEMYLYSQQTSEEPGKDGEIRFEPFALIWKKPNAKPGEPPLRVTAESAVIRFSAEFDMRNPNPGRPVYGALEGNVRIDGPQNMAIRGRNFIFDEQALRLHSDNPIQFQWAGSQGSGHGLQVDFLKATTEIDPDLPKLGGMERVTILRKVHLELTESSLPNRKPKATRESAVIDSEGRLQFLFANLLLTLDDRVKVVRPNPSGLPESLRCRTLAMQFREKAKPRAVPSDDVDQPESDIQLIGATQDARESHVRGWLPEELELQTVTATGRDEQRVRLAAPAMGVEGDATVAIYNPVTQSVTLTDPVAVNLQQPPHELHVPHVELELMDDPRSREQTVGRVVCEGPGWLQSTAPNSGLVRADWKEKLVRQQVGDQGVELIELHGSAKVQRTEMESFTAQKLKVWVLPGSGLKEHFVASSSTSGPTSKFQMKRLEGEGNVVMLAPGWEGHLERLTLEFQQAQLPTELRQSQGLLARRQPRVPLIDQPQPDANDAKKASKPEDLIVIHAEQLTGRILQDRTDPNFFYFADCTAEKQVEITQTTTPDKPPLHVTGDWLKLRNLSPQQQVVNLRGKPAVFEVDQSRLEAGDIEVDRQANTVTVHGPGSMHHLVTTTLEGEALPQAVPLHLEWKDEMKFDGKILQLFDHVVASLKHTRVRSHEMHITLSQPLVFTQLGATAKQIEPKIAKVVCQDRVEVEDAVYKSEQLISIRKGKLGHFELNNETGKTEAQGPGWIMVWRRASDKPSPVKPPRSKSLLNKPTAPWEYLRIDFAGQMKGNLHERFTTFEERVEIVYGPVQNATERLDPDSLPDEAAWMRSDSLQVTQYPDSAEQKAHFKLLASGNTELEAQTFHARSDSVKFDESTGLYILRSLGNKVTVRKEPTPKDPRAEITAQQIEINPELKEFRAIKISRIQGG